MKKRSAVHAAVIIGLWLSGGGASAAESRHHVSLAAPAQYARDICVSLPGKGKNVIWKGVEDKRPAPEIGVQSKKSGKDEVVIYSDPPPALAFNKAVEDVLKACGVTVESQGAFTPELRGELVVFETTVEKKLISGKNRAESKLRLIISKGLRTVTIDVGYEIEGKDLRRKGFKKIEATAEDLFLKTLRQIPASELFVNL